jgi:hypothetical protein
MSMLFVYRNDKSNAKLEETVKAMISPLFDKITETLAWLDGGQVPSMEYLDPDIVKKYV